MEGACPRKAGGEGEEHVKLSPWWWGVVGGLVALGLVAIAFGLFQPGWPEPVESPAGGGKSVVAELKQKAAELMAKSGELAGKKKGFQDESKGHRVFVSRSLVFLPKEAEPVQPLNPSQVTDDGIQVGWKLQYNFSPEDPEVAQQDEDQDGFTNLEEFEKKTDPRDPKSSPSKWVKVKIASVDPAKMAVSFSGKSEGRYTLRFKSVGKPKDVDVVIGDQLWVLATGKGVEIVRSAEEAKAKAGGTHACPHAIGIGVKEYKEDKGIKMDEKTKTENEYDDSTLVLERKDGLSGAVAIKIDERGKSRGVEWSVGDVRLISLVPGEGEMGPFRVGQTFPYAEKIFGVVEATGQKVTLRIEPGGETVTILPK